MYEGEVMELTPEEAPSQTGGYGKVISHVVIGLKSVKGTKQLKLDPTIYDRSPHTSPVLNACLLWSVSFDPPHDRIVLHIVAESTASLSVLKSERRYSSGHAVFAVCKRRGSAWGTSYT